MRYKSHEGRGHIEVKQTSHQTR